MAAASQLTTHYDDEADLIAVWWARPRDVVCVEQSPGIFLHVNPHTDEVVGYEIEDFLSRFAGTAAAELPLPGVDLALRRPLHALLTCSAAQSAPPLGLTSGHT